MGKTQPKNNEARSVGDPACGDCSAVMGALYGVTLIGLTTIILMVDASTALPLSDVDEVAIEAQPGVVRTLLSAPVSLDSMLAQAEKLGSGESTFNMLTARPKQQSAPEAPVLFDYTPPVVDDYLSPVAPAAQMCEMLLWLEDWRSSKSLTMTNPMSYEELYDLQCDTQAKLVSCTTENAEKLRNALEKQAAYRGCDQTSALCCAVQHMCNVLTYGPTVKALIQQPTITEHIGATQMKAGQESFMSDFNQWVSKQQPKCVIRATTNAECKERKRSVIEGVKAEECRIEGFAEWIDSLHQS